MGHLFPDGVRIPERDLGGPPRTPLKDLTQHAHPSGWWKSSVRADAGRSTPHILHVSKSSIRGGRSVPERGGRTEDPPQKTAPDKKIGEG